MSLYFVFTVDGDWDDFFSFELPKEKRMPDKKTELTLVKREIETAAYINGKLLHFIHSSEVAPDFFLQDEFVALWKEIDNDNIPAGIYFFILNSQTQSMQRKIVVLK